MIPTLVPVADVFAAFDLLGIPHSDLREVHVTPKTITVVQLRRDEGGQVVAAGGEVATITTVIGIDRSELGAELMKRRDS